MQPVASQQRSDIFNGNAVDDTHTHTHTHDGGILSTLPEGFAFDAIITDPPYNMAEAVQHSKSEKAPLRGERSCFHSGKSQSPCTDLLSVSQIITHVERAETLKASSTSAS